MGRVHTMVELGLGGAWVDVTGDVYTRTPIRITRGRADEGARVDPSKCSLQLNNRDGRYSPRNPRSPYYGILNRNTPLRVSVLGGPRYLDIPSVAGARASTPDHASLDITGDLDIRVDVRPGAIYPNEFVELAAKGVGGDGTLAWSLLVRDVGRPWFGWTTDGTNATRRQAEAHVPVTWPPSGRAVVRVTLDVNNGAGGCTITFYQGETLAGPWEQLGDPIIGSGTTSVHASTAPLQVGDTDSFVRRFPRRVYGFELRDGINGTAVAAPDFSAPAAGDTSFVDGAGRTWTLEGGAEISDRRVRFAGEVSSWPVGWDVSGRDVYTTITASGIKRRLGQGSSSLPSTLRRRIPNVAPGPLAYWPMEDGPDSERIASPIAGVEPLRTTGLRYGAATGLAPSNPLPTIEAGASITAPVPASASDGWHVEQVYLLAGTVPASPEQEFLRVLTSGSPWPIIQVRITATAAYIYGWDIGATSSSVSQLVATSAVTGSQEWKRFQLTAWQDGGTVRMRMRWITIGGGAGEFTGSWTGTVGRLSEIRTQYGSDLAGMGIGHLSAWAAETEAYNNADHGYTGESAGDRVLRLCTEEGLPVRRAVDPQGTTRMGAQRPDKLLTVLEECADSEAGVLFEERESLGLVIRDRSSTYNQAPGLVLDYAAGEVAPPLAPVDDDQATRNDITVTRREGSSSRVVVETGPLSIQAPPDGVGRYESTATLSLYRDYQTADQAGWRAHLGTWDEARYPRVRVNLMATPHLIDAAAAVDIRDRLQIVHPPAWLPPEPIGALVQGYTETLGPYTWDIEYNCTPARPWDVAVAGTARADTAGSTLTGAVSDSATTLTVASVGSPWTTAAGDTPIPIMVGGELMSVTAVSGASSPQTMTVTRAVNGISKSHSAGAAVTLADPPIVAL